MADKHREPEDFTGWVTAGVDGHEWEIACGAEGCGAFIADASWFDVQLAMILNANDVLTAREAYAHLPPVHLRRFRMHVQFPPHWSKDDDGTWTASEAANAAKDPRRDAVDRYRQRYIRGKLRHAELSQEAMPPVKVRCPTCGTLQVIARRVRKGAPPLVPEERAS